MKIVVVDSAGMILRTCSVPDADTAALQLGGAGVAYHEAPSDAGMVDDASLCVVAGALALKPGAKNPKPALLGLAVKAAVTAEPPAT